MITKFDSVQTAAVGSNWVTLPSVGVSKVTIFNSQDVDLDIRRADETANTIKLPSGTAIELTEENANKFELKRSDNNNTQLTIDLVYSI